MCFLTFLSFFVGEGVRERDVLKSHRFSPSGSISIRCKLGGKKWMVVPTCLWKMPKNAVHQLHFLYTDSFASIRVLLLLVLGLVVVS